LNLDILEKADFFEVFKWYLCGVKKPTNASIGIFKIFKLKTTFTTLKNKVSNKEPKTEKTEILEK